MKITRPKTKYLYSNLYFNFKCYIQRLESTHLNVSYSDLLSQAIMCSNGHGWFNYFISQKLILGMEWGLGVASDFHMAAMHWSLLRAMLGLPSLFSRIRYIGIDSLCRLRSFQMTPSCSPLSLLTLFCSQSSRSFAANFCDFVSNYCAKLTLTSPSLKAHNVGVCRERRT